MAVIHISGRAYEIVQEHRAAWNLEMFRDRYSEVLDRYDYIVGDWGYNQLRLKGFFKENNPKSTKDTAMSGVMDYINEYCNFGCAYFILEKQPAKEGHSHTPDSWESDAEMEGAASAEKLEDGSTPQGISLVPKQIPSDDSEDALNAELEERPQTRAERHRRIERQFRTARAERQEKQERGGRPNRQDRQARGDQERGPRNDRGERQDRSNRAERRDSAERGDRQEGQERGKSNRQQRGRHHRSGKQGNGKQPGGNREAAVSRATESVRS